MPKILNIALLLVIFTISASLANSRLFVYQSLTAYFLFISLASIVTTYTGIFVLTGSKPINFKFNAPFLFFLSWCIYIVGNTVLLNNSGSYRWCFLVTCCLLYFSLVYLISNNELSVKHIYSLILIVALIESTICILQYFGVIGSFNHFFKVTGTWNNPNVTAMFLAMAVIPAFGLVATRNGEKKLAKYLTFSFIAIIIAALLLLQCRTALVGTGIAMLIVLNHRFHWLKKSLRGKNRLIGISALSLILIVSIPLGTKIYRAKQGSSDGRILVWKISQNMIADRPFLGFGYGRFEREYNLYQAKYFGSGKATQKEIENSAHVKMAYNEPVENAVEGGIIGMVLFTGLLISLIIVGIKRLKGKEHRRKTQSTNIEQETATALAGICAFAVMSLVNFTVQAIPVMALFVLYAAILTTARNEIPVSNTSNHNGKAKPNPKWVKWGLAILLIPAGSCFLIINSNRANAQIQNRNAKKYLQDGNTLEALVIFRSLEDRLPASESFRQNYGRTLMRTKNYGDALVQLTEAAKYTSDPDLYMNIGHCNRMLRNIPEAEANYKTAMFIQPSLFAPRFALMQKYKYTKDTVRTIDMAKGILALRPKVPSKKVDFYKREAGKYLQKIQHRKTKQK